MSYRTGTGIYWTRRPVALPKGEVILDDGVHELRARCGNLISDEPRTPTLETEPAPPSFDEIEPILPVTRRPVPTAYAPQLPGAAAPELWPGTPRNPQRRGEPMILLWSPRTSTSTSGTVDSPGVEGPVVSDHVPDDPATGGGDDPAAGEDDPGPDGGDPGAETGDPVSGPGDPGKPSFPDPFFPPSDPWRPPTPTDPSEPPAKVPEPGTMLLIGVGGAAAGLFRKRRPR
jgi:hypothetical protein